MELIIIGAGANTGAIIDVIETHYKKDIVIKGIADIEANLGKNVLGHKVEYTDASIDELLKKNIGNAIISYSKDMTLRESLYFKYLKKGVKFLKLISKNAIISESSTIGEGTIIMPGAIIRNNVIIGNNCLINSGSIIEHDVVIGNSSNVSSGVVLGGNVKIGDRCFIGLNATILPSLNVEEDCILGAGSVLTKNLHKKTIAFGNPAIPRGEQK